MRNRLLLAAALLVITVALYLWTAPESLPPAAAPPVPATPAPSQVTPPADVPVISPVTPPSAETAAATPMIPAAPLPPAAADEDAPPLAPEVPLPADPAEDLEHVGMTVRDFRAAVGENPVGTNAEITAALLGDNVKQVKMPVPPGSKVNAGGEMIDRWGSPYFFHQLSAKEMEIRSAGPDLRLWTKDDGVGK